jgi:hypothetical protein
LMITRKARHNHALTLLKQHVDMVCEASPYSEVCGRLEPADCAGCEGRRFLNLERIRNG